MIRQHLWHTPYFVTSHVLEITQFPSACRIVAVEIAVSCSGTRWVFVRRIDERQCFRLVSETCVRSTLQNILFARPYPPYATMSIFLSSVLPSVLRFIFTVFQQYLRGARGSVVGWGTMPQAGIPDEVIGFFSWLNRTSRTVALGPTQPLIEMSTRNLPGDKCAASV
jgi:hypothetical protein